MRKSLKQSNSHWYIFLTIKTLNRILYWALTYKIHLLEKEMTTHSSILAWKSPWTEEPGGLQSMGLHDWTCVHEGGVKWVGSNKLVEPENINKLIKLNIFAPQTYFLSGYTGENLASMSLGSSWELRWVFMHMIFDLGGFSLNWLCPCTCCIVPQNINNTAKSFEQFSNCRNYLRSRD